MKASNRSSFREPEPETEAGNGNGNGRPARAPRTPCGAAAPHDVYLKALGERVRDTRARRGMTRKILSRDSGVSERYLAQLESGQGNVSIVLLRQIAHAMNLPLAEIVREGPEPRVELTLLMEQLARLGPRELAEVQKLAAEKVGAVADRRGRIALIGLRGAGKTALGTLLAKRLGVPFIELAQAIEADAGISLNEIFDLYGQAAYRRHERRALERAIAEHRRAVVATGGGLPTEPGTFEHLLSHCYTVWVRAAPEDHMNRVVAQGDLRPMSGNAEAMEDLRRILAQREALYAQADAVLDTAGRTLQQSVAELEAIVRAIGTEIGAEPAIG